MADEPTSKNFTPADQVPTDIRKVSGYDLLRMTRYDDFNDIEWNYALAQAELRNLDPLAGQVHFVKRYSIDSKAQEVVLLVGIEGLRLIADRTGIRGSAGPGEFEYDPETRELVKCTFRTEKKVDGEWKWMVGQARRDEYLGMAMGDFAVNMPHAHLEKCAEAASLRRGWPQELGNLYTPEEMEIVMRRQREQHVDRAAGRGREAVDEPYQDDVPTIQIGRERKRDHLADAYRQLQGRFRR